MRCATFDSTGKVVSHGSTVAGDNLPIDTKTMTDEEWFLSCAGKLRRNITENKWEEIPAAIRTAEIARTQKLAALAAHRYAVEIGGITVAGLTVATDRESQAMLTGAWVRVQQNPDLIIDWKGETGWMAIDKAIIDAMSIAVGNHVQDCFTMEKLHADTIAYLPDDVAVIDAYDVTTGWPSEE